MSRRLGPVAVILSVFAFAPHAVAAASPASPSDAGRPLYVALGDSITFGYNLSPGPQLVPSGLAYPFLVGRALGYQTVDNGIPGLTASGLLKLVRTGQYNKQLREARLVTIDIGSNDLLHIAGSYLAGQRSLPPPVVRQLDGAVARFASLEAQLLGAVRARTKARIVLLNLYDPLPPGTPLFTQSEQVIGAMNRVLTRDAALFRFPVIDVYSLFNGRQLVDVRVLEHDVHPTAAGQAQIAASLVQAMQPHQLASLVPIRYAVLTRSAALYASSALSGRQTPLTAGVVVRVLSSAGPRTARVQTVTGPPASGYLSANGLGDVFIRYRQHATFGVVRAQLTAGGYRVTENGQPVALSYPPIAVHGQMFLPLAPLARALGLQAVWQQAAQAVALTTAPSLPAENMRPSPGAGMAQAHTIVGTLRYGGIGLFVDGARVAAPSLADEPFMWRGQVYAPLHVIDRMLHMYSAAHAPIHTISLLNPYLGEQ